MGEQTLGAATSVRTAELCRNAHLSTRTPPPSSSSPTPTTTFPTRWNTSVSFPQPSSPSPLLSSPCPVPNSSKSLEASAPSFLQSMPIPTKASRTPALDLVLEPWVPLQQATASLDRTVTSHSGQALVHLSTPTDRLFPNWE